jgi:hypothetical protein
MPPGSVKKDSSPSLEGNRSAVRGATLLDFYLTQPRDAWAMEMEITLRTTPLASDIQFSDVECRAAICRVMATGSDRESVFRQLSATTRTSKMKMYARQVSDSAGATRIEAFFSPSGIRWPKPDFTEG